MEPTLGGIASHVERPLGELGLGELGLGELGLGERLPGAKPPDREDVAGADNLSERSD